MRPRAFYKDSDLTTKTGKQRVCGSRLFCGEKKYSLERRMNIANGLRGRKLSEATRKKISEATKKVWASMSGAERQKFSERRTKKNRKMFLGTARKRDEREGENYVYVIGASGCPGWYKVGVGNVAQRLQAARIWNPSKIRLVAYAKVPNPYEAETLTHRHFPNKGEWVRATPSAIVRHLEIVSGAVFTHGHSLTPPADTRYNRLRTAAIAPQRHCTSTRTAPPAAMATA